MAFATGNDYGQKFSLLKIYYKPKLLNYGICGGATDLRTMTLDQLYDKHLLGWNYWTRSNEGFDLARYFGTKVTLYPHPHISYFFYWQRNWEESETEHFPKMHPAWLMTHTRNRVLVVSRSLGGRRKKKIFIAPPALQTSTWYYASSWTGVALYRWGITPVNLECPFIHRPQGDYTPKYAVSIGYAQENNTTPPLPLKWDISSLQAGFSVEVMYRWWWDDGENNYILVNEKNSPPGPNINLKVVPVPFPYYIFFWGFRYPTAQHSSDNNPSENPTFKFGNNPSPVALFWYRDVGIKVQGQQGLFMNPSILRPQDLPSQQKVWVLLTAQNPSAFTTNSALQNGINEQSVSHILFSLVGNSPWVVNNKDIPFQQTQMNFWLKYRSYWQWGGTVPRPDTIHDPVEIGGGNKPVQVRNPATVGFASIHPWDLTQQGSIDELKLRAILTDILTPTGHQRPSAGRPQSPQDPGRPRARRRKHRLQRAPSPESSESSDDSAPESFESCGEETTPTPSESEEEGPATPPRRVLRR